MYYPASPIVVQPGVVVAPPPLPAPIVLMPLPPPVPDCPPGLEYLTLIDRIVVKQMVSMTEVVTGYDTKNRYQLLNGLGQQVYFAFEESDCCERQCCGNSRKFTMFIVDNFQRTVMRIHHPLQMCKCDSCCFGMPGCGSECTVEAPPGVQIAFVRQIFGCCANNFNVFDEQGMLIFRICGPSQCSCAHCCNCFADKVFEIVTPDGHPIGCIRKKWRGLATEAMTMADLFSVEFPLDLAINMKAALLAATFLIDFAQFEEKEQGKNDLQIR